MSGRGARKAGTTPNAEPPRALGPGWRAAIISALLVLTGYTAFTGMKLWRTLGPHAEPAAQGPALQAKLTAAEVDAALAPARTALDQAAQALVQTPDRPLDVVEKALQSAGATAVAAAVTTPDEVTAVSGKLPIGAWRSMIGLGVRPRTGLIPRGPGEAPLLVLSSPPTGRARTSVSLAVDLSALLADRLAARGAIILAADGRAAARGLAMPAWIDKKTLDSLKANSTADLHIGQADTHAASAPAADGALIAVAAEPGGGADDSELRRWADGLISLLGPLAACLVLMLVLVRQTRKVQEAQAAQIESEKKFRLAVEAARCGIWEWRLESDEVMMSDVTAIMLGWGGGGVTQGADVIARIAPQHRDRVRQALQSASQFGAFDVSFRVDRPTGDSIWVDARGQGYAPADVGFASIIGVALDVTEERYAEIRAQQAERRLSDAIDSVSEAFVLWGRGDRLVMYNRNFREFYNLEPRLLKPGADRKIVEKVMAMAVKDSRRSANRPSIREVEMFDGRWLHISERPTADGGVVVTASDISALKRQEADLIENQTALRSAVERLEDNAVTLAELAEKYREASESADTANRAKTSFLANMSHELRTPLNAIIGFSEMMQREMFGPLGDQRYKEYSGDILSSGQHLLALINDILDMSKIEAGKLTLHPEPLDTLEVADEAVRLVRTRADAGGLTLHVDLPNSLPDVEADYRAFKQILLNLLTNAVKFTPRGGRVTVSAVQAGAGWLRFSVTDTGIGIAETDLARLAKPFEQVESQHAKTQQGTGLGLALVKSLVERHGGTLDMTSRPGVGTTVSFTLPAAAPAQKRSSAA